MMENTNSKDSRDNEDLTPLVKGNSSSLSSSVKLNSRSHLPGGATRLHVTLCILITELCERLTFYGLTANMVPFFEDKLQFSRPAPSTFNLVFIGTCYFIPLIGGWLADTYTGRYNAIYGSSLVYFVGTVMFATGSCDDKYFQDLFGETIQKGSKRALCITALVLIAIGTGGIKANVSPFGADQVQRNGPRAVQRFFNWFYWFINIGSFVSFTLIVWVQQQYSFFFGYAITACSMLLGVITFLVGRNKYIARPPGGSILTDTFQVFKEAIKRCKCRNRHKEEERGVKNCLDRAKQSNGGKFSDSQVEDVKSLIRLFPVFAMFIVYWCLYSQMQTSYLIQAQYMNLDYGFQFPAASLSIFDIISVLLLIPIMDKTVYPFLRYCGFRFTPLRRIGTGMLFAAASVAVAGLVEIERKNTLENGGWHDQDLFNKSVNASNTSVFYQVPQFLLIGTSEVFTSITGLEFAYSQAPKCLQGLVMGIFLVTSGLGNYLSGALANIVFKVDRSWYPVNPNNGHLERYFFFLAVLMLGNFLIFLIVAIRYEYVVPRRDRGDRAKVVKQSDEPSSISSVEVLTN